LQKNNKGSLNTHQLFFNTRGEELVNTEGVLSTIFKIEDSFILFSDWGSRFDRAIFFFSCSGLTVGVT
jgi:hypothetical protein